ncbi:hypothetical protein [Actinomadura chokoriensis]|uniref:Uncharacterized protein n=1 Tax=Actinomadura chokoriensis TaxID=454156 RepID=A0ABV4QTR8_9ACTN
MSTSDGDRGFEVELEVEIEAELTLVESSRAAQEAAGPPAAEWLFDPTDAERDEVGLRNLLGAAEALEGGHE